MALLAAQAVVIAHGAFVLFSVFGGWLVLQNRRWALLHIPAFFWAGFIELTGGICPLTPLENRLLALSGKEGYGGGFIEHTLSPLLYPENLTREVQIGLGIFVFLLNAVFYCSVWRRLRQGGQRP